MASSSSCSKGEFNITGQGHQLEFQINYAKAQHLKVGEFVSTETLKLGGYEWTINYYPKGQCVAESSCMSLTLQLKTNKVANDIRISSTFDIFRAASPGIEHEPCRTLINCFGYNDGAEHECYFMQRSEFKRRCVKDECFFGTCTIVITNENLNKKEFHKHNSEEGSRFSKLHHDLYKAYEREEMTDVTFEVEGKSFAAHRVVLAARSPIFKAELFGQMAESNMERIKIKDMSAVVFKLMIHYIYNDTLPEGGDMDFFESESCISDEALTTMKQHLLVAADRYQLDGLKAICEGDLCCRICLDTVMTCLALADQHNCFWLKDICLGFATEPDNFMQLTLTDGYVELMQSCPSLLVELRERASMSPHFKTPAQKKQRVK
ncbi:hypothetical protein LUZ60_000392 [Juncus effusus]|nr:hypothetical protein LUZ60_000392 [Juncus effusus]